MHIEVLDANSRNNLLILKKGNLLNNFYLAGETAVALHLGHRISFNLDFFSVEPFDGFLLTQIISNLGDYKDILSDGNNLIGTFNGTKISFIHFMPATLEAPQQFDGVYIASIKDLMAMKVEAISQRGTKPDFIDLFFIMQKQEMNFIDVMLQYVDKYKGLNPHIIPTLKSFTYFDDAEKDNMPEMKLPIQWKEVREFFKKQKIEIILFLDSMGLDKKNISNVLNLNYELS